MAFLGSKAMSKFSHLVIFSTVYFVFWKESQLDDRYINVIEIDTSSTRAKENSNGDRHNCSSIESTTAEPSKGSNDVFSLLGAEV